MYYTIYKTTNQINGTIYVGYHSTEDLADSYLGSGKILNQAIEKNGVENFVKEILYVFPSREEALQKEREIVNEEFVQREDTYNVKLGGEGGWDHIGDLDKTPEALRKRSESMKNAIASNKGGSRTLTDKERLMGSASKPFLGKRHSKESRKKISESQKMDETIVENRIQDYIATQKKWGYISKLANKWEISHTQVRRFLKQNGLY
jgi:group I intron endonuclease